MREREREKWKGWEWEGVIEKDINSDKHTFGEMSVCCGMYLCVGECVCVLFVCVQCVFSVDVCSVCLCVCVQCERKSMKKCAQKWHYGIISKTIVSGTESALTSRIGQRSNRQHPSSHNHRQHEDNKIFRDEAEMIMLRCRWLFQFFNARRVR